MTSHSISPRVASALLAAALLGSTPALAQSTGDGFLFRTPRGSFTVRAGFDQALAGGDLFSFVTSEMTLRRADFGGFTIAGDLAATINPQLDIVFGASWSGSRTSSAYRTWSDSGLPITQTTSLERVPLTTSLKWYVRPRGSAVGRFAWIPARAVPYLAVGLGAMWSRFHQVGDIVSYRDSTAFHGELDSKSWTFTAHALAGLEMSLGPRAFLTTEARYTWAKAALSSDFVGFGRIDLTGIALTAGFGIRM